MTEPCNLLTGTAETSTSRLGFDTASKVNATAAAEFFDAGCSFAVRYVGRGRGGKGIERAEAETIIGAGLALMLVQYFKKIDDPSAAYGARLGRAAAYNAAELGYHPGCSLWFDLEGMPQGQADEVLAHANAWHDAVSAAGFAPGVYVGPTHGLQGVDLYRKLRFTSYWRAASRAPEVPTRGWQMTQSRSIKAHGVSVDFDVLSVDHLGGRAVWLAPLVG